MTEGLDIRLNLPFLNDRRNEPTFVSFIVFAELCGAVLFVAFVFRILFMVRNMHRLECEALRQQKLNELMASISNLEQELKEKRHQRRRVGGKNKEVIEEEQRIDEEDSNDSGEDEVKDDNSQSICETEAC